MIDFSFHRLATIATDKTNRHTELDPMYLVINLWIVLFAFAFYGFDTRVPVSFRWMRAVHAAIGWVGSRQR